MLIKLFSFLVAIISAGILSRVIFKLFSKRKRTINSVLIVNLLTFLSLLIIGYFVFDYVGSAEQLRRSFLLFLASLFIWIAIDLMRLESSSGLSFKFLNKDYSLLTLLILLSIGVSIYSLISYPTEQQRAAQILRDEIGSVMDGLIDDNPDNTFEQPLNEIPRLKGKKGEIELFLRETINSGIKTRNDYRSEILEANVHTILDPSRIRGTLNKVHTEKLLNDALRILDKYTAKQDGIYAKAQKKIKKLNLEDREKELLIYDFNKSIKATKEKHKRLWEIEREVFMQSAEIAQWLGDNNDAWIFNNNQFQFYTDEHLLEFNEYSTNLQKLLNEQNSIIQASAEKMDKSLQLLE